MLRRLGQPYESIDLVADVAKTASLAAVAVHCQVLAAKRLFHEVGNDTAIVQLHARAIGIKDSNNTRIHVVIAMVGHGHSFAEPFGLIINRTWTNGIHMAPVGFFLRMLQGIAVAFGGGGNQVFRSIFASYIQSEKSTE